MKRETLQDNRADSHRTNYGWKDLLTDAAILGIVFGAVLLVIGSFPEIFGRLFPFLK